MPFIGDKAQRMGLTAGRYSCPLERTSHAIRASLLAAVVMTTLIGARSSSASSHAPNGARSRLTPENGGSCAVHKDLAQAAESQFRLLT